MPPNHPRAGCATSGQGESILVDLRRRWRRDPGVVLLCFDTQLQTRLVEQLPVLRRVRTNLKFNVARSHMPGMLLTLCSLSPPFTSSGRRRARVRPGKRPPPWASTSWARRPRSWSRPRPGSAGSCPSSSTTRAPLGSRPCAACRQRSRSPCT